MPGSRWEKVFSDLWGNKTRTGLIVLSITVGLVAVGIIVSSRAILSRELQRGYADINPSQASITIAETFDEDFVRAVSRMPGVAAAGGRRKLSVRYIVEIDQAGEAAEPTPNGLRWRDLQLFAVPDYEKMEVNKIRPYLGAWPPPARQLLIERSAMEMMGVKVGDVVIVETADRQRKAFPVAGEVRDLSLVPSPLDGMPRGYISYETLDWLGEERGLNELDVVVSAPLADKPDTLRQVVNRVKDRLEKMGYTIPYSLSAEPGQTPLGDVLQAMLLLLAVLGFLALFLSIFLIVNTISALVTQQSRQIGIMKAIGAQSQQIVVLYLSLVLAYGLLALVIAIPLGMVGARQFSRFMADFFNFELTRVAIPPQAVLLQVAVGLVTPLLAALYPVMRVARVTAAQAMSDYGTSSDQFGKGLIDRWLTSPSPLMLRLASRPMMLALRNTFRRKGRLVLTLITLTLGGAIFISIFSVRASMTSTLSQVTGMYHSDLWVNFSYPQRLERVERQALAVPGVTQAEGWARMPVRRVYADGSEGDNLVLYAPPLASGLLQPSILTGRWLQPGDRQTVVFSTGALKQEPDVKVGDEVVLKVDGREASFKVVGTTLGFGVAPIIYAGFDDIGQVIQDTSHTSSLMIVTGRHDSADQVNTAIDLEQALRRDGTRVNSVQLVSEESAGIEMGFQIVILLAIFMAVLLAAVGGLGLMGTLSINVLERTREIGVMRAVGAADGSVARIFMAEAILIGTLSWGLGALLAIPLSGLLSQAVGLAFLQSPLSYRFSLSGVLLWLIIVVILSGVASFLPARNASKLTVREVLAYE